MRETRSHLLIAGCLLMLTGVLHVIAFFIGGFGYGGKGLAPVGLLFIAMGFGLLRGWRWLAYLTYLVVGIGVSFAVRDLFAATSVPDWWFLLIIAVDVAVVVVLFGFLWRRPDPGVNENP